MIRIQYCEGYSDCEDTGYSDCEDRGIFRKADMPHIYISQPKHPSGGHADAYKSYRDDRAATYRMIISNVSHLDSRLLISALNSKQKQNYVNYKNRLVIKYFLVFELAPFYFQID